MARMLRTPLLGEIAMAAINFDNFRTSMRQTNGVIAALTDDKLRHIYDLSFAKPSVRQMTLSHYRALDSWKFAAWEPGLQALTARVPMIILWGDRDPYIAPAYADRFGATQVEHFADYGHWFAIEAPEVIANRLIRFFN
jgi:pimeloyl-ACP methyl ester carboxylesterase